MKKKLLIALLVLLLPLSANADIVLKTVYKYPLSNNPQMICTNGVFCYYASGNKVFNYVNIESAKVKGRMLDLQILPTGTSFYALYADKDNVPSLITDNMFGKAILSGLNNARPECFCFTSDASRILTVGNDSKIHVYSILNGKFKEEKAIDEPSVCSSIAVSPNLYFIVTASGSSVNVYNYETGKLRLSIPLGGQVNQIVFTSDGSRMYVLCDDSCIYCFDTVGFKEVQRFGGLGQALSFDVTKDGKYIAAAVSGTGISIINTFNPSDRYKQEISGGGLTDVFFCTLRNGSERLVYNTLESVVFSELSGRAHNYTKLLKEELGTRLDAWIKRLPDESLEEYSLRVNDETISSQSMLLQQEIATELAGMYFELPEADLKGYDYSNQLLPISLGGIQDIYLQVPQGEILSFSDAEQLEFSAPVYVINEEDDFELVYVEVTNRATGKCYVFDNREMKSLEFLSVNDKYVPLDLIQLSNSQGVKLDEIKNEVIDESIDKSYISSHTKVNVSTNVAPDYDADGRSIFNFAVSLDYTVDAGFSEKEDYPSGNYLVEESGAAKALCEIITTAFTGEFKDYLKQGKKVKVSLTGTSDASAIRNAIRYDGEYGEFSEYPAYDNGVLCDITVNARKGIKTNDELAFIRAAGLKDVICREVTGLKDMDCTFVYNIHVSDQVGAEHRRVSVVFTFIDAF